MAQENLRFKVTADTKQFVQGMKQVQSETGKVNAGTRRQGQAFTQLAYALDDAQYGFRGVQNNLQAMAVTAGASGPVVLGITALSIVIGVVIEKFAAAKKGIEAAEKSLNKFKESVRGSQAQGFILSSELRGAYNAFLTAEEGTKKYTNALNLLKKNGIDPVGKSTEEVKNLIEELAEAKTHEGRIDAARTRYQEDLTRTQEAHTKAVKDFLKAQEDLQKLGQEGGVYNPRTGDFSERYKELNRILERSRAIIASFPDDVKKLDENFQGVLDSFLRLGTTSGTGGAVEQAGKTAGEKFGAAFQSAIQSSITSLAQAIGQAFVGGDIVWEEKPGG